jgi:Glycosyl hydrolase family 12
MVRIFTAGIALIAAVSTSALATGGAQAKDVAGHANILCRQYQHITVTRGGVQYVVRNDNYGHRKECLRNRGRRANFAVVTSAARADRIEPVAYPNIFVGCSWGVCSSHSGLPLRVGRIRSLTTTWHTTMRRSGVWGAGYDIWFDRRPARSGQSGGAELMIWLNAHGFGASGWPVVTVDGVRWHLEHWVTSGHGKHWNYIQFRRVDGTDKVTGLNVKRFIDAAVSLGYISPRWWLTSVMAGFEIWRGGVGLSTTQFMVRV